MRTITVIILLIVVSCNTKPKQAKKYEYRYYDVEVRYLDNTYDTVTVKTDKYGGRIYINLRISKGVKSSTLQTYLRNQGGVTFPVWATEVKTFRVINEINP